jgi:transcriptional regulator with XRE-family HTH domain
MGFSERLKELREKKGLSQEALAEELKIPRSSITHYENTDDRLPRKERLNEIANFFNVSVDYLIGRTDTTEFKEAEKAFMDEVADPNFEQLSFEKLQEKYGLTIDGRPATKEEVAAMIAFIRTHRQLKG